MTDLIMEWGVALSFVGVGIALLCLGLYCFVQGLWWIIRAVRGEV